SGNNRINPAPTRKTRLCRKIFSGGEVNISSSPPRKMLCPPIFARTGRGCAHAREWSRTNRYSIDMKKPPGAAAWVDGWMARYPWRARPDAAFGQLVHAVSQMPEQLRVAVHAEAVARLPRLRADKKDPLHWEKGATLYALVCRLYDEDLPRTERDVCALLKS